MQENDPSALPEKPPTKSTSGGCCSSIATFLGLEPRAVGWLSIGSLRLELGVTLSRRPSRSPTEPSPVVVMAGVEQAMKAQVREAIHAFFRDLAASSS